MRCDLSPVYRAERPYEVREVTMGPASDAARAAYIRCASVGPDGTRCDLPSNHTGDHESGV